MKLLNPTYLSLFTLIIVAGSCSSGKSAYDSGNYYDAVMTAANRLCRNPGHRKSSKTLCAAYPLAIKYHTDRVNVSITSNVEFRWREVVQQYTILQSMHDQIQRCPGSLKVIAKPVSYQVKLDEAKQKAAEESYNAAILALGAGGRNNAKNAYYLFVNANEYVSGYKDVSKKIEEALAMATVKVAVEPIPVVAKNYALDAHYFDSKLNEYLRTNETNEFVKYYSVADAKSQGIIPDHIVQLAFEEFSIGQVYVNEKESQAERDSVVIGYTVVDTKGIPQKTITEAPVIVPGTGVVVGAGTQSSTTGGTAEGKSNQSTEKSQEVTPVKTEEKPGEVKTEASKSNETQTNTTKTEEKIVEEKNTGEADKKDNTAAVGVGVGVGVAATDKKEEKPDGTKAEETKTDGSDNGNKKDDASNAEQQVTICHQPPGNPAERKALTVPQSAVEAHLAHGDVIGDCPTVEEDGKKSDSMEENNKDEKSEEKKTEQSDDKNVAVGVGVGVGVGVTATEKSEVDSEKVEEKVTICHQPPGKPNERKTMTLPQSAVNAHLAHGDVMGECKTEKKNDKGNDTKGKDGDGEGMASLQSISNGTLVMIASSSKDYAWYLLNEQTWVADTTRIYGKVKATVHQFKKTITSRGVLNFRIIDNKTKAVISEQRMPSESVWISEWLTYNGDSRALTPEQIKLAGQKELQPPNNQALFSEFSKPLFDQITAKLIEFYRNY